MLNIIIPMYNSLNTITYCLDSLRSQTKKNFIVTLIDDCGKDNYDKILKVFSSDLNIEYIRLDKNRGPGLARQAGIDNNEKRLAKCDYLMFLDSDDRLYPRAVEVLYAEAKKNFADIVSSKILVEQLNNPPLTLDISNNLTWFHGKVYSTSYLQKIKLRFNNLRVNEDSYFNLVAHLMTDKKFYVDEITYLWCYNKNSLTRSAEDFSIKYAFEYLESQVEAAKIILNSNFNYRLGPTIANIYKTHQLINKTGTNLTKCAAQDYVKNFINDFKIQLIQVLSDARFLLNLSSNLQQTRLYNNSVIFFSETFTKWLERLGIDLTTIKESTTILGGENV